MIPWLIIVERLFSRSQASGKITTRWEYFSHIIIQDILRSTELFTLLIRDLYLLYRLLSFCRSSIFAWGGAITFYRRQHRWDRLRLLMHTQLRDLIGIGLWGGLEWRRDQVWRFVYDWTHSRWGLHRWFLLECCRHWGVFDDDGRRHL